MQYYMIKTKTVVRVMIDRFQEMKTKQSNLKLV